MLLLATLTIPACTSKPGVSVENEKFRWDLELSTFQAVGVTNKLTGEYCSLGHGEELAVYLDASDARIELGPWKRTVTSKFAGFGSTPPERDPGYEKRYFSLEVDDADWETSPVVLPDPSRHVWGRTRFHLPDAAGRPVHIVLGGHGSMTPIGCASSSTERRSGRVWNQGSGASLAYSGSNPATRPTIF